MSLFDPAEYLIAPDGSGATPRKDLGPCSCGCTLFEWAVEPLKSVEPGVARTRTALRCTRCFRGKAGRVIGHVDMAAEAMEGA